MQERLSRLVERLSRVGGRRTGEPPALVALDVGTEFAKALVVAVTPDAEGRVVGTVRGAGRQRQGLTHMQSGTVSDIDAVVANCARALAEAQAMAGLRPKAGVIGIAGELVKGTTSTGIVRRNDPQAPMTEDELARIVEQVQAEALGEQVELAVFNAFAPMVHLGALQSVATQLGLELLGVIAEPYAVATCLDPGELGDAGAVFVDVGGGTTDVALVRHGGIAGTKMLALGGRAFTRGLVERFSLSFARAEALKVAAGEGGELPESIEPAALDAALTEDASVWLRGVELMIADLAEGELLPGRVYLCGGGAQLPQLVATLNGDTWWRHLPFARQPQVRGLSPEDVAGVRDASGQMTTRQDVTPMALAHQALILDASTTAAERAMRRAVRSMQL